MHSRSNVPYKRHCSFVDSTKHFFVKTLRIARKKLIHSSRIGRGNFVLFKLGEFCRRGDEFRGLADDHLSRTSPARFRVPSASQVSAFTLRSRAEISRVRARAHARGFLWERAIIERHVLARSSNATIESIRGDRHRTKTCSSSRKLGNIRLLASRDSSFACILTSLEHFES